MQMIKDSIEIIKECSVSSVNSESFILGSEFVFSSLKKTDPDPNMKLLLFTERIHIIKIK